MRWAPTGNLIRVVDGGTGFGRRQMTQLQVKQALLQASAPDGSCFVFAILQDERCAILRDGEPVHIGEGDRAGIDAAIAQYLKLVADAGGQVTPR